jgi:hypothetical protein
MFFNKFKPLDIDLEEKQTDTIAGWTLQTITKVFNDMPHITMRLRNYIKYHGYKDFGPSVYESVHFVAELDLINKWHKAYDREIKRKKKNSIK